MLLVGSIICNGTAFFSYFFLQVFRKLPQTMRKIVSLQLQIKNPGIICCKPPQIESRTEYGIVENDSERLKGTGGLYVNELTKNKTVETTKATCFQLCTVLHKKVVC